MKQSWIVGIIMIYVVLQGWSMIAMQSTIGDASVWSVLGSMYHTNLTTNVVITAISAVFAPAASVMAVFSTFMQAIVMYYPVLWQGNYIWFWECICLPIAISFIISVITIIRGVHAS